MADVIELFPAGYDGLVCACGSAWWVVEGITVDRDGHVTGYTTPLRCFECGAER